MTAATDAPSLLDLLRKAPAWSSAEAAAAAGDETALRRHAEAVAAAAAKHGGEIDAQMVQAIAEARVAADPQRRELLRLSTLGAVQYERERLAAAQRLGMRASVLDRLVAQARERESASGQGSKLVLDDPVPSAEPVVLSELLDEVKASVERHVVLPPHAAEAITLWVTATWAVDFIQCAALLNIRSPVPRCGKTTLLSILGELVRRPLPAANVSPAALFRVVEVAGPTLLIDEADAFFGSNEELRGIVNAGFARDTAYVVRAAGDDFEPRRFNVFAFKAISLIGRTPATVTDRSIVVELRRKLPSEKVEKLRRPQRLALNRLRAALARWRLDEAHLVADAEPSVPESLNDRAADMWTPLFAIADLAGGDWPERARRAAEVLSGHHADEAATIGVELLADIRRAFATRGVDRIAGADLLADLLADEERPWATFNKGKALSQAQLARRLREFGIVSGAIRLPDGRVARGYVLAKFDDAFERYLPHPTRESVTALQTSPDAACNTFSNRYDEKAFRFDKVLQASNGAACNAVTLSNPRKGDDDAIRI